MVDDTNWSYSDYRDYDVTAGRAEFQAVANPFLLRYRGGFELSQDGAILAKGSAGVEFILQADLPLLNEPNVDAKVHDAIRKWRNRHLDLGEKKAAILEMAGVFEWLKKSGSLEKVLSRKDESALFEIANNFALRHHNPAQKRDYDENIWYSWMFHFYLATYHAVARLLLKHQKKE